MQVASRRFGFSAGETEAGLVTRTWQQFVSGSFLGGPSVSPLLPSSSVLSPSVSPFPSGPLRTSPSPLPSTEELKVMLWGGLHVTLRPHRPPAPSPQGEIPAHPRRAVTESTCQPQQVPPHHHRSLRKCPAQSRGWGGPERASVVPRSHSQGPPVCIPSSTCATFVPLAPRIQGVQSHSPSPHPWPLRLGLLLATTAPA